MAAASKNRHIRDEGGEAVIRIWSHETLAFHSGRTLVGLRIASPNC